MFEDEHAQGVISIVPTLKKTGFRQINTKFGPRLLNERRMDINAIPKAIGVWDTVHRGKASYRSISMILAIHAKPVSESGGRL